jgi:plasmid maintenance system antidote protein VapI
MQDRGWSEAQLAWALGYSLRAIACVIDGERKITPELALRLEGALGERAETWQRDHELWQLRERMGGELARIRRRIAQPLPDDV